MFRRRRGAARPRGRLRRGRRGRVEDQREGAVGLARAEVGAQHGGLGGDHGAHRVRRRPGRRAGPRWCAPRRARAARTRSSSKGTGPARSSTTVSAFSCAAAWSAWCRGTATGRAAGSQRASDSVEVKAGRAVRPPAFRVGTAMSLVFSRRSPFSSSSTSPSTATTGTSSRAPLRASRTGPAAVRSSAQAASAALSRGSAVPSSSEKPGSGMFLFATVTDPIGGMLLGLCGSGNLPVTALHGFLRFP